MRTVVVDVDDVPREHAQRRLDIERLVVFGFVIPFVDGIQERAPSRPEMKPL